MKKMSIFAVVALLLLGLASTSMAAEIKASGKWQIEALNRSNFDFLDNAEDNTLSIEQRMRTAFQFIANENLKAVLDTQIGTQNWGNGIYQVGSGRTPSGAAGGSNTASTAAILLRKGYIDFKWPGTKVNFLVGFQTVNLPAAFGGGSPIIDDQVAAAVVSAPITDNVKVLAGYARPYDSQAVGSATTLAGHGTSADMVFAAVPVDFKGYNITPYAAYMNAGYNAAGNGVAGTGATATTGFAGPNSSNNEGVRAYWGGVAFTMTAFEPFKVMADLMYGKATWNNQSGTNAADGGRSGWMADIAVDYTGLKMMTPSLFFVYTSGENGNSTQKNSSGRMPLVGSPQTWAAGSFFFHDQDFINANSAAEGNSIRNVMGFWTIGASLKDITFIDKLKHTVHLLYIKGTNDADYLKESGGNIRGVNYGAFLTTKDSLWEVDLNTKYMIYDELSMYLNLGYINADIDKDTWGASTSGNAGLWRNHGSKDAYKVGLGLAYAF